MEPTANTPHEGLEGITVALTELSHVDGEAGVLLLRGHSVERLAGLIGVEDVAHLLWHGQLPSSQERQQMQARLYAGRHRAYELLPSLGRAFELPDGMDALRAASAQLSAADGDDSPALVCGALAVFAAAYERRRQGLQAVPPSAALSHAADYLAMLHGAAPSAALEQALASYLVTVSDHGMNASTFTARVVASTGSDLVSSVVAAIGALKGPLHGGAPGPVLDMLDAIGDAAHALAWLERAIDARERIMGMGHRIYRVRDPRAAVLEQALRALANAGAATDARGADWRARLELARAVEAQATELLDARNPSRKLRANVEFFTAVLLEALGIDRRLFSATFAVGRALGWCAHYAEQRRNGRLIRPDSRYVGPMPS
jgi:citrate synthase